MTLDYSVLPRGWFGAGEGPVTECDVFDVCVHA